MFYSHWHDCSTVIGTIDQQSPARLFNSHWHDCLTVTGRIIQQWLERLFNSHWHDSSTVTGTFVQQSRVRFFNSHWHDSSTVTGNIFSFFYAGRIFSINWADINLLIHICPKMVTDTKTICIIKIENFSWQVWSPVVKFGHLNYVYTLYIIRIYIMSICAY